ncbi:MAG: DUF4214 domain-containing protein [Saccharofermentans sp.]|nr:DUF4214 domain-containing protein [Saccharofermentans sp.]
MRTKLLKKFMAVLLTACIFVGLFTTIIPSREVHAESTGTIVNVVNSVNVRSRATTQSSIVCQLAVGSKVNILSTVSAEAGDTSGYSTWYKVEFVNNGAKTTGYIASHFVQVKANETAPLDDKQFEESIKSFPESYKPYLRSLHKAHPKWTFEAINTNIDWYEALNIETKLGVSLIENSVDRSWKSTAPGAYDPNTDTYIPFDGKTWVNASRAIVAYYMDPRNGMTNQSVFQFADLSYPVDDAVPVTAVEGVLSTTFMKSANGTIRGIDGESQMTYAQVFAEAGNISNVHPVFLAAKVIQEVGSNGSRSTNGATGYYNFYNIGAYSSSDPIANALKFAQYGNSNPFYNEKYLIPWNTQARAIVGGAKWISENYNEAGQDTVYFMRFSFCPNSKYQPGKHQYMTATQSCVSEATRMYNTFVKAGMAEENINFKIPVYLNMPDSACPIPTSTNSTSIAVKTTYSVLLGREPSTGEAAKSCGTAVSLSCVDMVAELAFSNEMALKNYSDEEFLKKISMALTGQDPTAAELNEYISLLNSGHSRKYIFTMIANSQATKTFFKLYGLEAGEYKYTEEAEQSYQLKVQFVELLYNKFLGRSPDRVGIEGWTYALDNGFSGPQIAASIFNSNEYLSKNLSDDEYLTQLYRTCLGREPDAVGYESWMAYLRSHYSRNYILAGFINSIEFKNVCAQYGVSTNDFAPTGPKYELVPNREKIGTFVTFLYNSTLNRNPDPDGFEGWVGALYSGALTGEKAAHGFIFSPEFTGKNVTNEEFVGVLYQAFLGRGPDAVGLESWTKALNDGHSREEIFNGFSHSEEFINKCLEAGIKPYDSFQ